MINILSHPEPGRLNRAVYIPIGSPLHCGFKYSSKPSQSPYSSWKECLCAYLKWLRFQISSSNLEIMDAFETIATMHSQHEGVDLICSFHLNKDSPNQIIKWIIETLLAGGDIFSEPEEKVIEKLLLPTKISKQIPTCNVN